MKITIRKVHGFVLCFGVFAISMSSCCKDKCKSYEEKWEKSYKTEAKKTKTQFPLNVYIENSGSMDGYVVSKEGYENFFKTDTYAMISNSAVSTLSLNYINSKVFPTDINARDFILNLTPNSFMKSGGNRESSDISAVVELALNSSKGKSTMMISDFIFSPDASHRPGTRAFLKIQSNDFKNITEKLLKKDKNNAVVLLQGISPFKGGYWNVKEERTNIDTDRPYYVLLAGNKQELALLMNKTREATHYVHAYSEFNPSSVNYEILSSPKNKVGNFQRCKNSKHHIRKIQTARRQGEFEIQIAVDFSNMPLASHYFTSVSNYKLSDSSYILKSITPNPDKTSPFTHIITIANANSGKLKVSDLEITLVKNFPKWIEDSNDPEGLTPLPKKTFGLKAMADGIKSAYQEFNKEENNYYTKFTVFLEK